MRFFSNESKDSDDDRPDVDVRQRADQVNPPQARDNDLPDHVQSQPVAVPQQRAGSPWSSGPDNTDAEPPAGQRRDQAAGTVANGHDDNTGRPPFHEPAPQPTAGAAPAGVDDRLRRDDSEVRHGGDTPVPSSADPTNRGSHRMDPVDLPLDDNEGRRAEDPTPPDTSLTGTPAAASATGGDPALKDEGGFDDPKVVDPATGRPVDASPRAGNATPVAAAGAAVTTSPTDTSADDTGPNVTRPGDTGADRKPGSVAQPDLGSLFGTEDAQSFRERWRDVQLRFVDSPKDATGEAARLVDEAVDKLAAGLKAQRGTLAGGSDDTEKLRIELRGYREMLNRILDL